MQGVFVNHNRGQNQLTNLHKHSVLMEITPLVSAPHQPSLLIPQGDVLGLGLARQSHTIPLIRPHKERGSNSHLEGVLEGKIQEGGQRGE